MIKEKWITDRVPEKSKNDMLATTNSVLVSCQEGSYKWVTVSYYNHRTKEWGHNNVIAWQPLPEPFDPSKFKCKYCETVFDSKEDLNAHLDKWEGSGF